MSAALPRRLALAFTGILFASLLIPLITLASSVAAPTPIQAPFAEAGPTIALAPPSPDPRNLTFYLHNSTIGRNINGVNSPYLMDSLRTFGINDTVSAFQTVQQDWYLYPLLAGGLKLNGTVALHAYVSASGTTPQITPRVRLYERPTGGVEVLVIDTTFGSRNWWNTPHDLALVTTPIVHTFAPGSSIRVILEIQAGTRTATIWWNATWVPSHLILQSDDFARVANVALLDASGTPRVSFDPLASSKDIKVVANVTDPLGGYDLRWVNLTITGPGGAIYVNLASMNPLSWPSNGFQSNFTLKWNYSGRPTGPYTAAVRVVDYAGYYAWSDTGSWTGNYQQTSVTFYIGGVPFYVNLQAVDSQGRGLGGALLTTRSGGVAIDVRTLDPQGFANVSLLGGSYLLEVAWQRVVVASYGYTPTGNVTDQDPLMVHASVFYPTFTAQDSLGSPLSGAALLLTHPNGTQFGPFRTDTVGQIHLNQMATGSYGVEVDWRGVEVFHGPMAVESDASIPLPCAVYQLTVHVVDSSNNPLVGAFVSLQDTTGLVFDANITDASGTALLRLPQGTYDVAAIYRSTYLGSEYGGQGTESVVLDASKSATLTVPVEQPSFTSTILFPLVLAFVLTTAALGALLFLMWRRGRGPHASGGRATEKGFPQAPGKPPVP